MARNNVEINKYNANTSDYSKLFPFTKLSNVIGYRKGFYPQLVVTVDEDTTVTVTQKSKVFTKQTTGKKCYVDIDDYGDWNIKTGYDVSKDLNVDTVKQYNIDVPKIIISIPYQLGTLTYNGREQTPKWGNYDSAKITIGGVLKGTKAGTYEATFTPKKSYKWNDGTTGTRTVKWYINRAVVNIPYQSGTLTYNKNNQTPVWNNYDSNKMDIGGATSSTNAGDYRATFTLKDSYEWSDGTTSMKTIKWVINKAVGQLNINPTSMQLNSVPRRKQVTVSYTGDGTINVSGTTSYIRVTNLSNSSFNVDATSAIKETSATLRVYVTNSKNYTTPNDAICTISVGGFGTPINSLPVGSIVKMKVNGSVKEWIIVNQGSPSSLYDSSCNGTWCLLKDVYLKLPYDTQPSGSDPYGYNDYENSTVNNYLNNTWINYLESDILSLVKIAKIPYRPGNGRSVRPVYSGNRGLPVRAFLLSCFEVGGGEEANIPEDGAKLDYFNLTLGVDDKRVALFNGREIQWWTRTPDCEEPIFPSNGERAKDLWLDGFVHSSWCSDNGGVRPAIILSSEAKVDKNNNVIK